MKNADQGALTIDNSIVMAKYKKVNGLIEEYDIPPSDFYIPVSYDKNKDKLIPEKIKKHYRRYFHSPLEETEMMNEVIL